MKKSVIFIGIEVVHAVLDSSRDEAPLNVRRHDALTLVMGEITGALESGLLEGLSHAQRRAGNVGERRRLALAGPRQLSPKVLVTRGLLLATPALFALVAPAVARAALAAAQKNTFLKTWLHGALPAPPPRLPSSEGTISTPSSNA